MTSVQGSQPSVWIYPPNDSLEGWEDPILLEDGCPTMADAHDLARRLRKTWPGHLVAVTNGKPPLLAVTDGCRPRAAVGSISTPCHSSTHEQFPD